MADIERQELRTGSKVGLPERDELFADMVEAGSSLRAQENATKHVETEGNQQKDSSGQAVRVLKMECGRKCPRESGSANVVNEGEIAPSRQQSNAVKKSHSREEDVFDNVDVHERLERSELGQNDRTSKLMEHNEKLFHELRQAILGDQLNRDAAENVRQQRQDHKDDKYLEALHAIDRKLN